MATRKEAIGDYVLGNLLSEGKTKKIYDLPDHPGLCLVLSKDRITAGDGVRAHEMSGKAEIANTTNCEVFRILSETGLKTAFVKQSSPTSFIAKKCAMIPIEWVIRRLATGSFLKRNPGVVEGFRFAPLKQETFFKDDANHDPQWSDEQIISAKLRYNGVLLEQGEVSLIKRICGAVFEVLERAWVTRQCVLVDMKIEFGVDEEGNILLADVIDSDSWRLWPSGDKRLRVDKDVYRQYVSVSEKELEVVRKNFSWTCDELKKIVSKRDHLIVILMGSISDKAHCEKIAQYCKELGLNTELRVTSAHKGPEDTLQILREYESYLSDIVFIAVAGRSNGLGPVLGGSATYPVINCPPTSANISQDIWSSLNMPSGVGCVTVLHPETAALHAAQILGFKNFFINGRLRMRQINNIIALHKADKSCRGVIQPQ